MSDTPEEATEVIPYRGGRPGSMGDLLEQGPTAAKAIAGANNHDSLLGINVISEDRAATLQAQYVDPMTAQQQMLAPGVVVPSIHARGDIRMDTKNGTQVTIIKLNTGRTQSGKPMHTVVDKDGQAYKLSVAWLK
jgi:hypothetical protein